MTYSDSFVTAIECDICEELHRDGDVILYDLIPELRMVTRTLVESTHILAVAGLGSLVEGYVVIWSKPHYLNLASLPDHILDEICQLKSEIRRMLELEYGPVVCFEHGPASSSERGGCCVEHAHLHVCPCEVDLRKELRGHFAERRIRNPSELTYYGEGSIQYLLYEDLKGRVFVYEVASPLPSQYLRRLWARAVGMDDRWNWVIYPFKENIAATVEHFRREGHPRSSTSPYS